MIQVFFTAFFVLISATLSFCQNEAEKLTVPAYCQPLFTQLATFPDSFPDADAWEIYKQNPLKFLGKDANYNLSTPVQVKDLQEWFRFSWGLLECGKLCPLFLKDLQQLKETNFDQSLLKELEYFYDHITLAQPSLKEITSHKGDLILPAVARMVITKFRKNDQPIPSFLIKKCLFLIMVGNPISFPILGMSTPQDLSLSYQEQMQVVFKKWNEKENDLFEWQWCKEFIQKHVTYQEE